jgi:hypothetical protein
MAWFAAALPYITTGLSVAGSVMQGQAQQKAANDTADMLEYNASVSRADAEAARTAAAEAEKKIERQQNIMHGKQMAAYGKSGFTTAGTPLTMMADTIAEFAKDRYTALWSGDVEAKRILSQGVIYDASANAQRKKGQNDMYNSLLSGLVSTGSSFGKSYVRSK